MTESSIIQLMYAFTMSLLWSGLTFAVLYAVRRMPRLRVHNNMKLMLAAALICAIRPLVIYEPSFAVEVNTPHIYPHIVILLKSELLAVNNFSVKVYTVFAGVWIVGAVFMLYIYLRSGAKYRHWLSAISHVEDSCVSEKLREIVDSTKPGAKYKLLISPQISNPALYGIVNPVILMPDIAFSEDEMVAILRHEWNHYLHKDNLMRAIVYIVRCLFWWNPLTHLLCREVSDIQEQICDVAAIKHMGDVQRHEYIMSCVCATEKLVNVRKGHAVASRFSGSGSTHLRRMESLAVYSRKTNKVFVVLFTLFFIVTLMVSYVFIFQAEFESPEIDNEIFIDESFAYLVPLDDGKFALFQGTELVGTITEEGIMGEPFSQMPIIENEGVLP